MEIRLEEKEKKELEVQHKTERDKRVADRIKAVLLFSECWTQADIAQALRIHTETVHDHITEYIATKKLKPENGGSQSRLNDVQTIDLINHLELNTYAKVEDICAYVLKSYDVRYAVSGMTKWLHAHEFSYKKPKATPAKADPIKQDEFIETYEKLMNTTPAEEPILFADGVHPTMATKISEGWIRTGKDKPIATTASRTRMNLMGALNLTTMEVIIKSYETIDSLAMSEYFAHIKEAYPTAPKIHMIVDRGPYNTSYETKEAALKHCIVLHYLPAYSPNLNPIERVWKVMNEQTRNNRCFASAKEFRQAITDFFQVKWPQICMNMVDRINDNFQRLNPVSSG